MPKPTKLTKQGARKPAAPTTRSARADASRKSKARKRQAARRQRVKASLRVKVEPCWHSPNDPAAAKAMTKAPREEMTKAAAAPIAQDVESNALVIKVGPEDSADRRMREALQRDDRFLNRPDDGKVPKCRICLDHPGTEEGWICEKCADRPFPFDANDRVSAREGTIREAIAERARRG